MIFLTFKNLNHYLQPTTIMTDFEQSSINQAFPNALQRGCLFHFSQCIRRRIQQIEGMQHLFSTDADFALQI